MVLLLNGYYYYCTRRSLHASDRTMPHCPLCKEVLLALVPWLSTTLGIICIHFLFIFPIILVVVIILINVVIVFYAPRRLSSYIGRMTQCTLH